MSGSERHFNRNLPTQVWTRFATEDAFVTKTGLRRYDRRWMIVDHSGQFMTAGIIRATPTQGVPWIDWAYPNPFWRW